MSHDAKCPKVIAEQCGQQNAKIGEPKNNDTFLRGSSRRPTDSAARFMAHCDSLFFFRS